MAPSKRKKEQSASDAVDAQLARYQEMRDFNVTAEPSGKSSTAKKQGEGLPFVVQKHAATRLHYDFRLGWRGVLKSWAVTKGPSYVTSDKRLAVQVEDHPMEYGGFEGTIPKGQYGGGTVMVWDEGTWEPLGDVDEGLDRGSLKFILHGKKLKGKWTLVRMGGRAANESKPNWLLIKEHDEFERKATDPAIVEEKPDSAVTGRDLEAIAHAEDHVWHSKQSASQDSRANAEEKAKGSTAKGQSNKPLTLSVDLQRLLEKTPKESLPKFLPPQLASQATAPPAGQEWIHELKLDGYRIQAHLERHEGKGARSAMQVKLFTRSGLDWTARMRAVAEDLKDVPVASAILDGEVVVLDQSGLSSFAELQAAFQEGEPKHFTYFVFDLLHLNGHNLRGLPLVRRKELSREVLIAAPSDEILRYSGDIAGRGAETFREACKLGAEGIVSKIAESKYASGRSSAWVKVKCLRQQEFVIGGYTLPSNGNAGVGALLLGYYERGKLHYAGRTGTGFTQKTSAMLREALEKEKRRESPFVEVPADARKGAIWVDPELVAEVQFATWTADNLVRQASFKGLREDKPAKEVTKEVANVDAEDTSEAKPGSSSRTHTKTVAPTKTASSPVAKEDSKQGAALPARLTHPDKVLDRKSGLTKRMLAEYYSEIAPDILPQIAGRPLSIIRCPEGSDHDCFFQRHLNKSLPKGFEGVDIKERKTGKVETFLTLSTAEALVELAQMSVMELHPWGCTKDDIEHPDRLIFDLDPDEAIEWRTLADTALEVRDQLKRLGLTSFLKTTGGKGLHVVAPIEPEYEWPVVKDFAHAFVLEMEQGNPSLYLTKMTKAARKGKIYLDYLRNERGATAVSAFSPRARPDAYVSLPMEWKELKQNSAPRFRTADFKEWKGRLRHDPWKDLSKAQQSLNPEKAGKSVASK
jgi:bifunctional non-homologous end joining protein LigD